ncbi:hypothetical protein LVJ94_33655 [Pendulispora rubella]|uniref:Uncharacterized protein n=1 Tax=Pendulispora rubella TaxID=2741070 RepID=A0ABZ2KT44_9BACT
MLDVHTAPTLVGLLEAPRLEICSSSDEDPTLVDEASPSEREDDTLQPGGLREKVTTVIGVPALEEPPARRDALGESWSASRDAPRTRDAIWRPRLFFWVKPLFAAWYALHRLQQGKPPLVLALFLGTGALVALITIGAAAKGLFVRPPAPAQKALPAAPAQPVAAPPSCNVIGPTQSVAPEVQLAGGLEAVAVRGGIAIGFAKNANEAVVSTLDPNGLSIGVPHVSTSKEEVHRVTPNLDGLEIVSSDGKRDPIASRRPSSGLAPIDIGMADGHLVWAARGSNEFGALWALEGDAAIDALRAVPLNGDEKAYILAFRRGASIWTGVIARTDDHANYVPVTALSEAKGGGAQVGAPSLAVSGETARTVWADRAGGEGPWRLRSRRWVRGSESPSPVESLEIPNDDAGASYISPSIVSLDGGRFLVVWSEGPALQHRVRAMTINAEGHALGSPLSISSEGANAGQGQAAVLPDGRGIVAYLAGRDGHFELMATPIDCPSR